MRLPSSRVGELVRGVLNTVGACWFVAGSIAAVLGKNVAVSALFVAGNCFYVVTGLWVSVAAHRDYRARYESGGKFPDSQPIVGPGHVAPHYLPPLRHSPEFVRAMRSLTWLHVFGALAQVAGAALFSLGCATMFSATTEWIYATTAFWTVGSAFFLLQSAIGHILATSFLGQLLVILPLARPCCQRKRACRHKWVPAALLNTLGSALFVSGSLVLCWSQAVASSGWQFLAGSTLFLLSNASDVTNALNSAFLDRNGDARTAPALGVPTHEQP